MTARLSLSMAALASAWLLTAPIVAAQDPPSPSRGARAGGDEVRRRGCLLRTAADETSPSGRVTAWHLRTSGREPAGTYVLVTLPDSTIDLAAHDGHHVEIRGRERLEGPASAADEEPRVQGGQIQDVGQAATVSPPSRSRAARNDRGPQRTLEVHGVTMLAETCPAS